MCGSNENIKEIIGIVSILNYLDLIQILITEHNKLSVVVKSMSVVLWSSANFCNISQNMNSKAPVASQYWKSNKVVQTWKYDWPL